MKKKYAVRYMVFSGRQGDGPIVTKEKNFSTSAQMKKWVESAPEKINHFYQIVSYLQ